MPKMLAQANRKLVWVPSGGIADVSAPTVTELTGVGVVDISCLVTRADYTLGASGDEEVSDPALCASGNDAAPGYTNYEASMNFFRWTGTDEDTGWDTFTGKGIEGFLVERMGDIKSYDTEFAAADLVRVFSVITGTPQVLAVPDNGGYEKFTQPFFVQSENTDERAVVATGV